LSASVAILTHQQQGLSPKSHLGYILRDSWTPQARRVTLHQGLKAPPAADLAFLHIDLTRTPEPYRQLGQVYPRCVNLAVTDIGKRRISRNLLGPEDDYDGPVLVKTELNHAGVPERRLARANAGRWRRLAEQIRHRLPPAWTGCLREDRYLLIDRRSAVPDWVWRAPGLVVERFFVERRGELYAMHMWYFLGDRDQVATSLATAPLVKGENTVQRLPPHQDVPDSLRQRRRELGFDYGKFDFVMVDGEAVLLDANRTPHASRDGLSERGQAICRHLAPGIDWFAAR
jgi:hypothetical protein